MTMPHSGAAAETSSTGLAANVAAALAYVLAPITGVIFLVFEKDSRFVRFHAAQSVAFGLGSIVLWILFGILASMLAFIPIIGWLFTAGVALLLKIALFIVWIALMYKAFSGESYALPGFREYAERISRV